MALPSTPLLITLLVAHLFVLLVLYLTWLFVRHAQRKHHEHMLGLRLRKMPKSARHELEQPAEEVQTYDEKRWESTEHELDQEELKAEQNVVENNLKSIKEVEESFNHDVPVKERKSMEERIANIPDLGFGEKNIHQESFESHIQNIQKNIQRKRLLESKNIILEKQLDSINRKLANIDQGYLRQRDRPSSRSEPVSAALSATIKPTKKQGQDWRESVAGDFENLYRLTSKQAEKQKKSLLFSFLSLFRKQKEQPFVAMHKGDAEKKAVELVRKISQKVEAGHPIPATELDWIEANLINVHKEIWGKD